MTTSLDFLRVVERAAIACAHTMGQATDTSPIRRPSRPCAARWTRSRSTARFPGIGEGERRSAATSARRSACRCGATAAANTRKWDIAVDPLEGTNLCATGAPNALAALAASEKSGLLHAPDIYMEKLVVGLSPRDVVDLDAPVRFNLRAIAQALGRRVQDLVVIVLIGHATRS